MNRLPRLEYPDCAKDCEILFERERELEEERNNWARAAEILAFWPEISVCEIFGIFPRDKGEDWETYCERWNETDLAAAYAIAELGENWREELKAKP